MGTAPTAHHTNATPHVFFMPSLTALFARTFLFLWNLAARFARFRKPNGYCLLPTGDAFAAAAALQFALLHFAHRALHFLTCFFTVSCHRRLGHRIATLDDTYEH